MKRTRYVGASPLGLAALSGLCPEPHQKLFWKKVFGFQKTLKKTVSFFAEK
jgi:hypothetical protein